MSSEILFLIGFLLFIGAILAIDLSLGSKSSGQVSLKQAGVMSGFVVALSILFYVILLNFGHLIHGIDSMEKLEKIIDLHKHPIKPIADDLTQSIDIYNANLAVEYITGYIVEYALSVDNIFVILLVFRAFDVSTSNYHKVLFWGILGAVVMRFIFIFVGAALISKFSWIMYIFGGFLLFTGIKMFWSKEEDEKMDTERHPIVAFANRYFKVHNQFVGSQFWVTIDGVKKMTPLFLVLLVIEGTDLIFAVDSIPAIFSVTKDPYIVFFSNIFAIIGLRSMFFLLAGVVDKFKYLKVGLAILLAFIGIKMILHDFLHDWGFQTTHSLLIIILILAGSIFFSLIFQDKRVNRGIKYEEGKSDDLHREV